MNDPYVEPFFGFLPYIEPFFAFFVNPFPGLGGSSNLSADPVWSFTIWLQAWYPYALFVFLARYVPFVVVGFLVAFYLSRRKRLFGWQVIIGAVQGPWIGFLVGLTYDAIIMIVVRMLEYMTPLGCSVRASSNPTVFVTPLYKIKYPSPGDTCLSLVGETVLFFMIFVVIGMGVYYLVGRRRGTRTRVGLAKGAAYGLLAAGSLMPFIIQYDIWLRDI